MEETIKIKREAVEQLLAEYRRLQETKFGELVEMIKQSIITEPKIDPSGPEVEPSNEL